MACNSNVWVLEDSSDDELESKKPQASNPSIPAGPIFSVADGEILPVLPPRGGPKKQQPADVQKMGNNCLAASEESAIEQAVREEKGDQSKSIPPREIKKCLLHHFQKAARNFNIAYHDGLKNAPNPGLHLLEHGMIGFPLSEADINKIKDASGGDASISTTRNTWKIESSRWETKNPKWQTYFQTALSAVIAELGMKEYHQASKSELILYWPGATMQSSNR